METKYIEDTLTERGARYGDFTEHASIAQELQTAMRTRNGWQRLTPDKKQALTVIADKIARILSGDPEYRDNWHDIQGYAKLAEERCFSTEAEDDAKKAEAAKINEREVMARPEYLAAQRAINYQRSRLAETLPKADPLADLRAAVGNAAHIANMRKEIPYNLWEQLRDLEDKITKLSYGKD